jgi:alpha-tubulin suppressor-like RCC1 family protein
MEAVAVAKEKKRQVQVRERAATYNGCISTGGSHTVGLKADGTVVAVGWNEYGQCDVSGWRDIVAVSALAHTIGLKADGTVVAVGYNEYGQCNVSGWRDIGPVSKQSLAWKKQGLCCHCGGTLSGVFTKKCKSCGKEN